MELFSSAANQFIFWTVNYTFFFLIYGLAIYGITSVICILVSSVYRFFKKKWLRFRDSHKNDSK